VRELRQRFLGFAFVIAAPFSFAQETPERFVPIPESAVEKFLVASQYGPEEAVLNAAFPRDGKWEFSGGYAYSPFSSLMQYQGWSGALTIHINRRHAIEPLYYVQQKAVPTDFLNTQVRDKILDANVRDATKFDLPKESFGASYLFSPYYAKMHITERTVTHFDVYLGLGAGLMRSYPQSLSGIAGTLENRPAALVTAGMRFLLPSRFGLRLELRDFIHAERNFGKTFTANTLQISLSTSIFFGAFP